MRDRSRQRILNLSLGDVELRLLRVFATIVHQGGFSAAQASLGMTQATISTHMRHLEERLGLRLCERGRSGFMLTDEGRQVHAATLDLFEPIDAAVRTRGLAAIYREHHPAPAGAEITARRIAAELEKRHIPPR